MKRDHSAPEPIQIRALALEDVVQVARLHGRVFPDYFLSHLGPRFLERFYGMFVDQPGHYGIVAVTPEQVVGFVVGTGNATALYRRFYRRHMLALIPIVAGRLLADGYIRRHIAARASHIGRALRALVQRSDPAPTVPSSSQADGSPAARLLSIGVAPECRGRGVAERMVVAFCERMRHDGIHTVGLTVRRDNARAIAFYRKSGWIEEAGGEATLRFFRPTQDTVQGDA